MRVPDIVPEVIGWLKGHKNFRPGLLLTTSVLPPLQASNSRKAIQRRHGRHIRDGRMSQETTNKTSRALSTARFLMTSQSCISEEAKEKKQREIWDAAERQVIRTEVPVLPPEQDHCSPASRGPSKPSLMDIISGKAAVFDPSPVDSPSSPTSIGSSSSTRSIRSSLTGYQWGGGGSGSGSLFPAAKVGENDHTRHDKPSAVSHHLSRANSCNIQQQNSQVLPDGQPRIRNGVTGRRHSTLILEQRSAEGPEQISSPKAQMSRAAEPDGQQHTRKGADGRRHSMVTLEQRSAEGPEQISSPKAQMPRVSEPDGQQHVRKGADARRHSMVILEQHSAEGPEQISSPKAHTSRGAEPDEQQHIRQGTAGRRHSLHIPAQQWSAEGPQQISSPKAQVPPAAASDGQQHIRKGTAGRRLSLQAQQSADGPQQISSPKAQMYSAASIAAIGRLSTSDVAVPTPTTAAVTPGKVVPLKLQLLDDPAGNHTYFKSRSLSALVVHDSSKPQSLSRSKTALTDGHAGRISSSSDGGTDTEGSMSGAGTCRRYVPRIENVDKQALQRGGEGDCTAYDTLLDASIQGVLRW